mmetsp:Transcript_8812/g.19409  ORF Transcript_8812/g.19409 Transcript_8812/m.19409 type:complete len:160 (-) Transcript_8812:112-591(-)
MTHHCTCSCSPKSSFSTGIDDPPAPEVKRSADTLNGRAKVVAAEIRPSKKKEGGTGRGVDGKRGECGTREGRRRSRTADAARAAAGLVMTCRSGSRRARAEAGMRRVCGSKKRFECMAYRSITFAGIRSKTYVDVDVAVDADADVDVDVDVDFDAGTDY